MVVQHEPGKQGALAEAGNVSQIGRDTKLSMPCNLGMVFTIHLSPRIKVVRPTNYRDGGFGSLASVERQALVLLLARLMNPCRVGVVDRIFLLL